MLNSRINLKLPRFFNTFIYSPDGDHTSACRTNLMHERAGIFSTNLTPTSLQSATPSASAIRFVDIPNNPSAVGVNNNMRFHYEREDINTFDPERNTSLYWYRIGYQNDIDGSFIRQTPVSFFGYFQDGLLRMQAPPIQYSITTYALGLYGLNIEDAGHNPDGRTIPQNNPAAWQAPAYEDLTESGSDGGVFENKENVLPSVTGKKASPRKSPRPTKSASIVDPAFCGAAIKWKTLRLGEHGVGLSIHSHFTVLKKPLKRKCHHRQHCKPVRIQRSITKYEEGSEKGHKVNKSRPLIRYLSRLWQAIGKRCASCDTKKTPLWRDAEDGTPLCNACGIRYKKYRIHCMSCWYIPKKDSKSFPMCPSCGALLRYSINRKSL